jgi:hypothetical protein
MQGEVPPDLASEIKKWPVELRTAVWRMLNADPEVFRELDALVRPRRSCRAMRAAPGTVTGWR